MVGNAAAAWAVTVTFGVGLPPVHDVVWVSPPAGMATDAEGSAVAGVPVAGYRERTHVSLRTVKFEPLFLLDNVTIVYVPLYAAIDELVMLTDAPTTNAFGSLEP